MDYNIATTLQSEKPRRPVTRETLYQKDLLASPTPRLNFLPLTLKENIYQIKRSCTSLKNVAQVCIRTDVVLRKLYIGTRKLDLIDSFFRNVFDTSTSRYNKSKKIQPDYVNYLDKTYTKIIYFVLAFDRYKQSGGILTDYYIKSVPTSYI